MAKRLEGKHALITGGTTGIGYGTAERFIQEGATVAITGRSADTVKAAADRLGHGTIGIASDVSKLEDIDRLHDELKSAFGTLDVIFANAGIANFQPVQEGTEEFYERHFGVNVRGVFFTVQKLLPIINDGASIILNASVAGQIGMQGNAVYGATKASVRSLARNLSADLIGRGIRVNSVSPGPIETPIFGKMGVSEQELDELSQGILSQVPLGRFGKVEEIAGVVAMLASADGGYIVGADIVIDGGMTQL